MTEPVEKKEPFLFYTRWHLSELLGIKASNLRQLLEHIKDVPGSCIYHHTHRFLQQHQYLSPEPPNDFAYWVREVLGDDELGSSKRSRSISKTTPGRTSALPKETNNSILSNLSALSPLRTMRRQTCGNSPRRSERSRSTPSTFTSSRRT
jgi:hypothetical protein